MASLDRKEKQFGFKRIFSSIKNSWNGLKAAYKNEQSVYIHLVCSIILLVLSFLLEISLTQWLIIIAIIGLTLVVELLNTAIESTVDLVTEEFHPLAKVAKDTASAAEFVLTLTSALIALMIFIPKIMELL
ncbi:MAG TPA: diacylglycerol kinase [Candidatus Onthousia faecipullorum]|uniref:Diacylglycerol kinase n=1 Tax=Candidatus Onthousia faecipullorum TaxID=2840887 RepID=A0A9D1GC75_9FIRM|nr:diacylglycerol kinase [Candidatus Onthousia faecipullorum]